MRLRSSLDGTDMLGTLLGNYRVVELLGKGGMGVLYVGRHEALGHHAALKVLRPEMTSKADMVQRFFNEAQAATAIHHPGIVQIFDFGTTPEGRAYFAMELLDGETLGARMKQRRLDPTEACRLGRQAANVLQAAHAAGITHRDLKPDNLFLVPDPEVTGGERVKVLDFGIAKLANELQAASVRTSTHLVMGTPSYMSPEHCRGAARVDFRSDIYSLACILFKMCCGRPPFVGHGMGDIISGHLHVPPPDLLRFAPDVPPALAALIARMLDKQPEARPQTMAAVSQALDEILRALGRSSVRWPVPAPGSSPVLPRSLPGLPATLPTPLPSSLVTTLAVAAPPPRWPLTETTLGSAVGVRSVPARAALRRLPLVIAGGAAAGALSALLIALATRGASAPGRPISYRQIATAPRTPDAAAPDDGGDGGAAPDASEEREAVRAKSPPPCLADAFDEQGRDQFNAGDLGAALVSFEAAYACRPEPTRAQKALIIACNLHDLAKARAYFRRLSLFLRTQTVGICVRNGITEDVLGAP